MPLRVAFVTPYVPPGYIGGGETYAYFLTKELARLGVEVDLYTSPFQASSDWEWEHALIHECPVVFRLSNTPVMPSLLPRMLSYTYDVIHTTFPSAYACDVSALASLIRRKPLVITYHCDLRPSMLSAVYVPVLRYTLRQAAKIIATTASYALTSKTLHNFSSKIVIIPMGAEIERFSFSAEARATIRGKHAIGKGEKVVLFVGGLNSFHAFKRVDLLLESLGLIEQERNDITTIVVGEGDLRLSLQQLARTLGLRKTIFTGYVPNRELPGYYSAADVFVLPSLTREEAFGIVLVEAAASGATPVCFDIPGPGELCRSLGGITVPLLDRNGAESLRQGILRALSINGDRRPQHALAAMRYSWRTIAEETLGLYKALL